MKKLKEQGISQNSPLGKNIKEAYRTIENVKKYTDANFVKYNKKVIPKLNKIEDKINEIEAEAPNYEDLPEIEQGYAELQERQKTLMGSETTPTESKSSPISEVLTASVPDTDVIYAKDSNIKNVNRLLEQLEGYTDEKLSKSGSNLTRLKKSIDKIKEAFPNYPQLGKLEASYESLNNHYQVASTQIAYLKDSNIKVAHRLLEEVEGYSDDELISGSAVRKLRNLENKINKVKETLPDYPQLGALESGYAKYVEKHNAFTERAEKKNEIERKLTNNYLTNLTGIEVPRSWAKRIPMTYQEFIALKNEFISLGGSEANTVIPKSEQFYREEMTSVVLPAVEKEINDVFGTNWQSNPEQTISKIEILIRDIGFLKNHVTGTAANIATWEKFNNKCLTELARLKDYKDNGGFAQFEADRREQEIDERLLRPQRMETPPEFTVLITTSVLKAKPDAKVNVIHITMSSWYVSKHELTGVPLKKYIDFDAAVTDTNGVCFRIPGTIYQIYEGGGNYTEKRVNLMYLNAQMRCANIPK
jgi:hypothetical protein